MMGAWTWAVVEGVVRDDGGLDQGGGGRGGERWGLGRGGGGSGGEM